MVDYRKTVIQVWNNAHEIEQIVSEGPFSHHYMPREEGLRLEKAAEEPRLRWLELRERIAKDNPKALAIAFNNQIGIKVPHQQSEGM